MMENVRLKTARASHSVTEPGKGFESVDIKISLY
jgi:hypothetical protein